MFTHLSCLHLLLGLVLPSMAEEMMLDHPDLCEPIMKRDRKEKRNLSVLRGEKMVLRALLSA